MQELKESLNNTHPDHWHQLLLLDLDRLIEKEKQHIIDAHNKGRNDKHNDFSTDGLEYYNEIFNK